ncbi:MAG: hypothetical protein HN368_22685 [Spirochaetales bacterium]|jgi:uroporphyrinogen decarboxylase|nr:hypothetical protein [Spirochaetales bacterium]
MTSKEIVIANIEHTGPPRAAFSFDDNRFNDFFTGGVDPYGYTQKRWTEGKVEYYDDQWGNIWVRMIGGSQKGEIHKQVVEQWSDLDSLVPPDYSHPSCLESMIARFSEPTDKFKLAHIGGWIFDNARYLRKMEIYLADLALYPEEVDRMHQVVASVYEQKIHLAGKAGADGIMIGEDMGTQTGLLFSPAMFSEFFKPMYTRLLGIAHEYGMKVLMHSCGSNREIIPDLMDAGIDVFQFDQPALYDMPELSALMKERKAALWSPVDIQRILPTGDRAKIEAGAQEMYRIFEGHLIVKNYPDLIGIGVEPEWDDWAYRALCAEAGL